MVRFFSAQVSAFRVLGVGDSNDQNSIDDLEDLIAAALQADGAERFELVDRVRAHPQLDSLQTEAAGAVAYLLAEFGDRSDLSTIVRLSLVAHEAGVDGAGRIHAEASDKIAIHSGRPQPYGTVMIDHHGEIVQPPVDRRFGDDERIELGLPPLAEMHRRMEQLTVDLAVERAAQPGLLPQGKRWCRVWTAPEPAELRARLSGINSQAGTSAARTAAWADGDILTLVCESPVPFVATPTFQIPSWPVVEADEADEAILQVLQVRVERLAEAVITYTCTSIDQAPAMNLSRGSHDGRFRGADAPCELATHDELIGSSFEHTVDSNALGEPRRITVYRPPGHEAGDSAPVVYGTDGNMIGPYLRRLDPAIVNGDCPPVVVVAAHSASFDPLLGNLRAAEYLPGFDHQRFENHHRFFVEELAGWAEQALGVPTDPALRGVFGCSDGGGHSLMVARRQPTRFGHVFAYSTGMPPDIAEAWTDEHPFVHLCAGTLEGAFHQATEAWAGHLMLRGADYHFTERVAGHDLIQWAEELPRALARAWGTVD